MTRTSYDALDAARAIGRRWPDGAGRRDAIEQLVAVERPRHAVIPWLLLAALLGAGAAAAVELAVGSGALPWTAIAAVGAAGILATWAAIDTTRRGLLRHSLASAANEAAR